MEGEQRKTAYQNLNRDSMIKDDHIYELCQVAATEEGRAKKRRVNQPENIKKGKNMEQTWNKPVTIVIIVLLSLMVILLVVICLMLSQISARDATTTTGATATAGATTGAITGATATGANTTTGLNTTTGVNTGSSGSPSGAVDDILLIAQKLYNGSTILPTTCEQLKIQHLTTGSGYYILASANGSTTYTAYCNMGLLCGSTGWTRIAYLHLYGQKCPSGFRPYQSGGYYRACGRPVTSSGSCVSVQFPSNGISYSQICGRVTGYQYGSTDAIKYVNSSYRNDINSYYVDGVSITRGSPRQHVWTLMAGYSESSAASSSCPCNNGSSVSVQSFIGNNYYCESGNTASSTSNTLYTSDRLWDGSCRSLEATCCNFGLPWFHRDYGSTTTTDYIELRVCGDEGTNNEDSPVRSYEIYIK